MSDAEKYRAFARECIRSAERAEISIEQREALLDIATTWAEAAVRLDYQLASIEQFDDSAGEARKNPRAASDGNGQTLQGNGSGHTNQTDDLGESKQQSGEGPNASAK